MDISGSTFLFRIWDTCGDPSAYKTIQMMYKTSRIAIVTYEEVCARASILELHPIDLFLSCLYLRLDTFSFCIGKPSITRAGEGHCEGLEALLL